MKVEKPTILFDGICNLCNGSIRFILKRDKKKQFDFVALQSQKGKAIITKYQIPKETDSVILIQHGNVFIESDAALAICQLLPPPWSWLTIFKLIPRNWRDKFYRWVAKNRYGWFGKQDKCTY